MRHASARVLGFCKCSMQILGTFGARMPFFQQVIARKGNAMRHLLAKFALTTAVLTGSVMAAQACPQQTVMKDTSATASFQLAQAGGSGGSGGSAGTGGAAGTAGGNTGTSGSGASGTPGATPGTGGTGAGGPVIPPNEPMRQPDIPRTPGEPGVPGQTSPQTPR
jgi:hypothetical protein